MAGFIFSISCSDDDVKPEERIYEFTSFSDFIDRVEEVDTADLETVITGIMDTISSFPIIEDKTTVYFVYTGNANSVFLAGDLNGWDPSTLPLTNVSGTDLWYKKFIFDHADTRIDYKFVVNGTSWRLDSRNPNRVAGGFGDNSELALPDYVQPWEIVFDDSVPEGTLMSHSVSSTNTGKTYDVNIYLPASFDQNSRYPTAYFHDGSDYLNFANAKVVLDNLIDEGIVRPIIAVFVTPTDRNEEYAFSKRYEYARFFVLELVPYIDENFSTIQEAASRATIGDSFGGNISAIISFTYPSIFGNSGWHSAAFWPNEFETDQLVTGGPKKNIRIASVYGQFEGGLTGNMREVDQYLFETGYEYYSKEYHEGHSWGLWRATIDDILGFLFPPEG